MKDNKGSLHNVRVLKKSMIFLQSYDELVPSQLLKSSATFAICGKVETVKTKQNYRNTTSYVTFTQKQEAAVALMAFYHLNSKLRVLFGTVQYCKFFMRKTQCRNETCVFMHARDKKNQIIVNDQINEDVYNDHYDMALKIAEEENFKTIRKILANTSIAETNIIKKGLKIAAEELRIDIIMPDLLAPNSPVKQAELLSHSTEESQLIQSKQQRLSKKEQQISRNQSQQSSGQQKVRQNFCAQDYIKIRLIKKLIRENSSKIYLGQGINSQHIHNRSKMILYHIVRY